MDEELIKIIRKMEAAGESRDRISSVVKAYTASAVKKKSRFKACYGDKGYYGIYWRRKSGKSFFFGLATK